MGAISKVSQLIGSLEHGERFVIDGLRDITDRMAKDSRVLRGLSGKEYDAYVKQLLMRLDSDVQDLRQSLDTFRQDVRTILIKL